MYTRFAIVAAVLLLASMTGQAFQVYTVPLVHNVEQVNLDYSTVTGYTDYDFHHFEQSDTATGPSGPGGTAWLAPHFEATVWAQSGLTPNLSGSLPAEAFIDYEVDFLRTLEVEIMPFVPASHYVVDVHQEIYKEWYHFLYWGDASENVIHSTQTEFRASPIGGPVVVLPVNTTVRGPSGNMAPEWFQDGSGWNVLITGHTHLPFVPAPPAGQPVSYFFDNSVWIRTVAETVYASSWGANNAHHYAYSEGHMFSFFDIMVIEN